MYKLIKKVIFDISLIWGKTLKIIQLQILNFRAVDHVEIDSDKTMIVIAGPNGCGKSCVLDAIRLTKSAYGGYDPHEFRNWLGEFQIDPNSRNDMRKVLRDKSKGAQIQIALDLHSKEVEYLHKNADDIGERTAVGIVLPGVSFEEWKQRVQASGQHAQQTIDQIKQLVKSLSGELSKQLSSATHQGVVDISPTGQVTLSSNLVLQSIWSIYEPQSVGIVDYHGPQRYFSRESLGGVHLSLKTQEEGQKQTALYNYAAKYANIKTQMATEYVIHALRQQGGNPFKGRELLSKTLQELFHRFFPGKEFQGVRANDQGELEFAVKVHGSDKHDINDLSSGEKEILFGYLRLRNNAQRQSIILLDEPELHLNPKLIQGLPQFYEKYVGTDLDNQIWAVTHSDAFLREAISSNQTKVLHMREAMSELMEQNQIQEISGRKEEESAILEIIGDIAGYRPGGKIVVFEGEESEFDKRMTAKLFPNFDRKMNFVSGGNRATVRRLHEVLDAQSGRNRMTFSIVDRDDATHQDANEDRGMFTWDVYHIENYLLDPDIILGVLNRTFLERTFENKREIEEALKAIAQEHTEGMVEDWVRAQAHHAIRKIIKLKDDIENIDAGIKVAKKVEESANRMSNLVKNELSPKTLQEVATERRKILTEALNDSEEWKKVFRGRDILSTFVKRYCNGLSYKTMRDMIVNAMSERGHQPSSMLRILAAIDNA